jgi:GNAT superfamily N-acetyltransferase
MRPDIRIADSDTIGRDELHDLYSSVGWIAYTQDPESLASAIAGSSYVVTARVADSLVGLARGLSDDISVFYLQDILVRPDWQRLGVGRALLTACLDRFGHVRQKVLLTDDDRSQHLFYEALGYADTRAISNVGLHAFVQISGLELKTR